MLVHHRRSPVRRLGLRPRLVGAREDGVEPPDPAVDHGVAALLRHRPLVAVVPSVAVLEPSFDLRPNSGENSAAKLRHHQFMVAGDYLNLDHWIVDERRRLGR